MSTFVCPNCGHVHECGPTKSPLATPLPKDLEDKSVALAKHLLGMLPNEDEREWDHKLNDWQRNFLTSVRQQFEKKGRLSERQLDVLQRMYEDLS